MKYEYKQRPLLYSESGGGIYGVGPCRYLHEIERSLNTAICDLVDVCIGTSIGGVDSSFIATGHSGSNCLQLHRDHQKAIFGDENLLYETVKCGAQYDDSAIVSMLKAQLGDSTMDQALKPLYLVAWDIVKCELRIFGPQDKDVPIWYAARCSMAAPTYFKIMDKRYIDGGVAANDPAMLGVAAAYLDGYLTPDMRVLNLVTSGKTPDKDPVDADAFILTQLTDEVLTALTSGNSAGVGLMLKFVRKLISDLGRNMQFYRVNPASPDYKLDAVSKASEIETIWANKYTEDAVSLAGFLTASN
jgi:patatin-like phospholipase/acyl hydrolase